MSIPITFKKRDDFDREDLARGYLLAEMHDAVATFAQRV